MKRKTLAFGLGMVLALAGAEMGLRMVGAVSNYVRKVDRVPRLVRSGETTILIAGNSHTLGAGAPPSQSYPAQLQRLLDKRRGPGRFRVINRGRGNVNSRYILEHLPGDLSTLHPDVVVLMMGEPDQWNRYGYSRYLQETGKSRELSTSSRLWFEGREWLASLKLFRLLEVLRNYDGIGCVFGCEKMSIAFPSQSLADVDNVGFKWVAALENGAVYDPYHLTREEADEAKGALMRLEVRYPENPLISLLLARISLSDFKDVDGAIRWYTNVFGRPIRFNFAGYRELGMLRKKKFLTNEQRAAVESLISKLDAIRPEGNDLKDFARFEQYHEFPKALSGSKKEAEKIAFVDRVLKVSPENDRACLFQAKLLIRMKRDFESAKVLKNCLKVDPFVMNSGLQDLLIQVSEQTRDDRAKVLAHQYLTQFQERFPSEALGAGTASTEDTLAWMNYDLRAAVTLIRRRGVGIILQTYPPFRRFRERRAPDAGIIELAKKWNIPLSDTYTALNDKFKSGSGQDRESFFSNEYGNQDNHLNAKGYRVVAEALYDTLLKNGWLKNGHAKDKSIASAFSLPTMH